MERNQWEDPEPWYMVVLGWLALPFAIIVATTMAAVGLIWVQTVFGWIVSGLGWLLGL